MKRRTIDGLLWAATAVSVVTIGVAHEDPWLRSMICPALGCIKTEGAPFLNKIAYDLAMGTLVSVIFYWLLVRLPDAARNQRLRHRLIRHYEAMKQECVTQLLFATQGPASMDDIRRLASSPVAFREHFYAVERAPWYKAQNRFDDANTTYFDDTKSAIAAFKQEVDFTIDHADIGDDGLFDEMKDLSLLLQDAMSRPKDYDGTKSFFGIMQMLLGGWAGGVAGTVDHDHLAKVLDRI